MRLHPLLFATMLALPAACTTVPAAAIRPAGGFESSSTYEAGTMARLVQEPSAREPRGKRHEFTLSRQRVEFDEFTIGEFDINGTTTPEVDLPDVEQTLTRLRYRFGPRASGFIVGIIAEELEQDQADITLELVGIELATDGFPHLGSGSPVAAAIDYGVGLSLRGGNDDSTMFTTTETDVALAELTARIGAGVDIHGLQISGGLMVSAIGAGFDNDVVDDPFSGQAGNAGPYLRIWCKSDAIPLVGGVQLMGGDIRGASVGIGLHF